MAGSLGLVQFGALAVSALLAIAPAAPAGDGEREQIERGVVALGRLLSHPEPTVRDAAADGLRALGSAVEFAFPSILAALAAGDGPRATAQALLERLGPRAAGIVPEIVSLGRSGNPGARELAVAILGTLTPCVRGAEGFLAETAATAARGLREPAARALLIADPTRTAARDLLATAVREGTVERDVRLAAALGRAGLDAELAVWIVRALDDEELANKRFAEEALAHVEARSAAALPALVNGLNSPLDAVRASAADAIGRIGPGAKAAPEGGAAIDALGRLLGERGATLWFSAARALARIQPSHGVTAGRILGALGDRDLGDVAAVLAEFEPAVAARELGTRFDRADAAAKLRFVELAEALRTRAAEQDDGSATSIAEMLTILRGRDVAAAAAALILRAVTAAEPEVRARALAAAATLTGNDEEVARLLLAALTDPEVSVRGAAIAAAARRSIPPAVLAARLTELPTGGDPAVAASGASELSKALAPALTQEFGSAAAARFDADDLIGLCVLSPDFELAGFTLRDAEIERLLEAASGPDEVRGRLAARALRRHDGPVSAVATARLAKVLAPGPGSAPDFVKVAAAELLDQRSVARDAAIDALVRALSGPAGVADVVAASLVSHGDAAARALTAVLADPSRPLRRRAIATLAAMKGRARPAVPALLACVVDADPELASAAAGALLPILSDGEIEARLQRLERGR